MLVALAVGIFFSVPALILGSQDGKIEARFPPAFKTSASFDKGDSSGLAVDSRRHFVFVDHESEVRAFGAGGEEIEVEGQPALEDSQGLAFDDAGGVLAVSEKGLGRITLHFPAKSGAGEHLTKIEAADLPPGVAGFEPEAMAFSSARGATLYAIDPGNEAVLRFSVSGKYLGKLDGSATPAGSFDFGSNDNDIAVARSSVPPSKPSCARARTRNAVLTP